MRERIVCISSSAGINLNFLIQEALAYVQSILSPSSHVAGQLMAAGLSLSLKK
jgi:hypothetical protein